MKKVLWGYNAQEVDAALETLSNQNAALLQHNNYMEDEMKNMRSQLDEAKAAIAAGMTQADADGYKELKFAYAALQEKAAQHEEDIAKARQEAAEAAKKEAAESVGRETEEAKRRAEAAKLETEEARRESEAAKRETEEARRETEAAKRETEEAKRAAETAAREAEAAKNDNAASKADLENARSEMEKLRAEMNSAKTEGYGAGSAATEAELNGLRAELENRKSEQYALREQLSQKESEKNTLREQLSQKESEQNALRDQLSQKESEQNALREQLSQKESEQYTLRAELEDERAKMAALQSEIENLHAVYGEKLKKARMEGQDAPAQYNRKIKMGELNTVLEKMFSDIRETKMESYDKMADVVNTFSDKWSSSNQVLSGNLNDLEKLRSQGENEFMSAVHFMLDSYRKMEARIREMQDTMGNIETQKAELARDLMSTVDRLSDDGEAETVAEMTAQEEKAEETPNGKISQIHYRAEA